MSARFSAFTSGTSTFGTSTTALFSIFNTAAGPNAVLCELGVSFGGTVSVDAPVRLDLCSITANGTTPVTANKIAWSKSQASSASTITFNTSWSVQPVSATYLASKMGTWYVHPQGGNLIIQYPLGREPVICDAANQGLLLSATTSAVITSTNWTAYIVWEE